MFNTIHQVSYQNFGRVLPLFGGFWVSFYKRIERKVLASFCSRKIIGLENAKILTNVNLDFCHDSSRLFGELKI